MLCVLVKQSRQLRKSQTPHEVRLWLLLRSRQFSGYKFRRQYVIEPYVVDFCCPEEKVVIELDGGGHAEPEQGKVDLKRDSYLGKQGYRVVRVWNSELDENSDGVTEHLYSVLTSPSPPPSPQRGEGE